MAVRTRVAGRLDNGFVLPVDLARPLAAAACKTLPATALAPLLQRYGFEGASCITARGRGALTTGEIAWSTYPAAWPALYRRAAHAAVDLRLTRTRYRVSPYLWDAADAAGDERSQRFIGDAARFGICSGVALSLHDGAARQVALTFDSPLSPLTTDRREAVIAALGDLVLIAMALHEGAGSWRVTETAPHQPAGPQLTPRECECLKFAAYGMTSADIGNKLCVTERTVNFHFGRLRRKLGALNRPEAIAKGVILGFVTLD